MPYPKKACFYQYMLASLSYLQYNVYKGVDYMKALTFRVPAEIDEELKKQAEDRYMNKTQYIIQLILEKKKENEYDK